MFPIFTSGGFFFCVSIYNIRSQRKKKPILLKLWSDRCSTSALVIEQSDEYWKQLTQERWRFVFKGEQRCKCECSHLLRAVTSPVQAANSRLTTELTCRKDQKQSFTRAVAGSNPPRCWVGTVPERLPEATVGESSRDSHFSTSFCVKLYRNTLEAQTWNTCLCVG